MSRSMLVAAAFAVALAVPVAAQQPQLWVAPHALSRQHASAGLSWTLLGRPGDLYVLLADTAPGSTALFGRQFDLGFSPGLLAVEAGVFGFAPIQRLLAVQPATFPPAVPLFLQFASFAPQPGLGSLLVSNVDSFAAHDAPQAVAFSFENMHLWPEPMTGSFDRGDAFRLKGLPAGTRTVRPLPPEAWEFPYAYPWQPLHPGGSRFQMVLRAEDLGAAGPERLVGVRWKPLLGAVTTETFPQFELLAAHSDVVPEYTIDPQTNLPAAPFSGLDPQFADNPRPGTSPVAIHSGAYTVRPQDLLPNGYLPFPLQQPFDYDGTGSLLLETRCPPRPGLGTPVNLQTPFKMGAWLQALPAATVYAAAGSHGQPVPMQPAATPIGTPDNVLFDWELVFERSVSVATSPWFAPNVPQPDYADAIVCGFTPPGASLVVEFRGRATAQAAPTAWSASPAVADGLGWL